MSRDQSGFDIDVQIQILDKRIEAVESGIRVLRAGMDGLKMLEHRFANLPTGEEMEDLIKKYGSKEAVETGWADRYQSTKQTLSEREVEMARRERKLGELKSEREGLVKESQSPDVKKNESGGHEHDQDHPAPGR